MTYDPPAGLSLDDLRRLLDALPGDAADTYQSSTGPSWIGVGMAVHHETDGSQEGFALWNKWSAKSSKYSSPEDCLRKWESFGQGQRQSVTARSLIKWSGAKPVVADFDVVDVQQPDATKPLSFDPVCYTGFAEGEPPSWIIKTVLPQSDLVVLFGESGSGKSFIALDMCMAVARGGTLARPPYQAGARGVHRGRRRGWFPQASESLHAASRIQLSRYPVRRDPRHPKFSTED